MEQPITEEAAVALAGADTGHDARLRTAAGIPITFRDLPAPDERFTYDPASLRPVKHPSGRCMGNAD